MESDGGHEDLSDTEADTSEAESVAGTDPGEAEVEPEVTVRRHNYNLRPKRRAPVLDGDDVQAKEIEIAPGAGVVADKNQVGGRDERASGRPYGASIGSESSDAGRSETGAEGGGSSRLPSDQALSDSHGSLPRLRHERPGTTLRRRLPATPLFASMSREELEAQSARVMARLRKSKPERVRMLPSPTNELVTRRDFSRPSDAGRSEKSRREPGASDLLGQVPVKPGRGLFSDNGAQCGARCRVGGETSKRKEQERSDDDRQDHRRTDAGDRKRRRSSPEMRVVYESHAPRNMEDVTSRESERAHERRVLHRRPDPSYNRCPCLAVEGKGDGVTHRSSDEAEERDREREHASRACRGQKCESRARDGPCGLSSPRRRRSRSPRERSKRARSPSQSVDGAKSNEEKRAAREPSAVATPPRPFKLWFKADKFDGSSAWRPFAERFRFCARVNGWDAEEQCLQLQACLHGMAAQVLCYGKSGEWTFEELFNKLEGRFGTEDRADEFLAKLETRKRGANETLQHLYHDIEKLVALSCPGPPSAHSDRYAVWWFLRALGDAELAEKVRDKQPKTLDEAFKMAQRFESFRVAIAGGKARGGDRERS